MKSIKMFFILSYDQVKPPCILYLLNNFIVISVRWSQHIYDYVSFKKFISSHCGKDKLEKDL